MRHHQLPLDLRQQPIPLRLDPILLGKEFTALAVALAFQFIGLPFRRNLLSQRHPGLCPPLGGLDRLIQLADLLFQAKLEILGPLVELVGLFFVKVGVARFNRRELLGNGRSAGGI